MRHLNKQLSLTTLVILITTLPIVSHAAKLKDPLKAQIHTLSNGLTVYLSQNKQSPRFYAEIAVRAGSKHDPSNTTGLAHYLEHLLFKGTNALGTRNYKKEKVLLDEIRALYEKRFKETDPEKRKAIYAKINETSQKAAKFAIPNELDRVYKEMGGTHLNAHTWHEETVYKVGLPTNRLAHWAQLEADRFRTPVIRLFQPELEVVYEEKNRAMDNKTRALLKAVGKALYKKHPYGQQPTLGSVEHLKNPSIAQIERYYKTHYVPGNMGVFISGDINIKKTVKILESTLGQWPKAPIPMEPSWNEPPLKGVERVTVNYKAEPMVVLAFHTAAVNDADADALKLLDMILDNRTAGLINLNLTQKQRVRAAGSFPQFNNDAGMQALWAIPKQGQTHKEAEDLLLEQLNHIKKGQFEPWLISAIVTDYKKEQKQSLESNQSRVSVMRKAFIHKQQWKHAISEIQRMEKLTKADVVRVANKYFGPNYVAGYRVSKQHKLPKIEKPAIDPVPIDPALRSAYAQKLLAKPVTPIKPTYIAPKRDFKTGPAGPGLTLLTAPNPINDLFSMSIQVDVGGLDNYPLKVAAELLTKAGAGDLSAAQLQQEWYKMGTSFSVRVGRHRTTILLSGLDENFVPSIKLMAQALTSASASKETVEQLLKIWIGRRKDAREDHGNILNAVSEAGLYGDHSTYKKSLTDKQISALTSKALLAQIQKLLRYKCTVSYTGTLKRKVVSKTLTDNLYDRKGFLVPETYTPRQPNRPKTTEIRFFHKKMAQAQVRLQFAGNQRNESQHPLMSLYNGYFGSGMDSIVFQELRESRALAYTARARYQDGRRASDFDVMTGFIGTQADKTAQALKVFIQLIDDVPVSETRFKSTKDALLTQYRTNKVSFRHVLSYVLSWENKGLKPDPRKARFAKIEKSNLKAMLNFHKRHIKNRPKLISIVGDKSRIDMDALKKLGTVVEVGAKDVFTF